MQKLCVLCIYLYMWVWCFIGLGSVQLITTFLWQNGKWCCVQCSIIKWGNFSVAWERVSALIHKQTWPVHLSKRCSFCSTKQNSTYMRIYVDLQGIFSTFHIQSTRVATEGRGPQVSSVTDISLIILLHCKFCFLFLWFPW